MLKKVFFIVTFCFLSKKSFCASCIAKAPTKTTPFLIQQTPKVSPLDLEGAADANSEAICASFRRIPGEVTTEDRMSPTLQDVFSQMEKSRSPQFAADFDMEELRLREYRLLCVRTYASEFFDKVLEETKEIVLLKELSAELNFLKQMVCFNEEEKEQNSKAQKDIQKEILGIEIAILKRELQKIDKKKAEDMISLFIKSYRLKSKFPLKRKNAILIQKNWKKFLQKKKAKKLHEVSFRALTGF